MKKKCKDPLFYKLVRPIIIVFFKCLFTPKIIGKDNIPKEGRIVLAGNHTNNFDCLLLIISTKRCIHFLAKKELLRGLKKVIFTNMGIIPVDRKIHDHLALETAEKYLNNDMVIGIFPEGTISKEKGSLLPFKIGAIKMAHDTNTLIVPFSITGEYKVFSRNLEIVFEKPIKVDGKDLEKDNKKLQDKIYSMIEGSN